MAVSQCEIDFGIFTATRCMWRLKCARLQLRLAFRSGVTSVPDAIRWREQFMQRPAHHRPRLQIRGRAYPAPSRSHPRCLRLGLTGLYRPNRQLTLKMASLSPNLEVQPNVWEDFTSPLLPSSTDRISL